MKLALILSVAILIQILQITIIFSLLIVAKEGSFHTKSEHDHHKRYNRVDVGINAIVILAKNTGVKRGKKKI